MWSRNISSIINWIVHTVSTFNVMDVCNGGNATIDFRTAWQPSPTSPHLISFNMLNELVLNGLKMPSGASVLDYVQVRINATRILDNGGLAFEDGVSMAIFANQLLPSADPSVMSNICGQKSVFHEPIHTPLADATVSYLKARNANCPLMREALKHFYLAVLQQRDYSKTFDFRFRGHRRSPTQ